MFLFWKHFVFHVAGKRYCKKHGASVQLSKFVTASDEAFACLILINNWDRWEDMADKKDKTRDAKYTGSHVQSNNKYGGWSKEGIQAFNQILRAVKKDRLCNNAGDIEEKFQDCIKSDQTSKKMKAKIIEHGNSSGDEDIVALAEWDDANGDSNVEDEDNLIKLVVPV